VNVFKGNVTNNGIIEGDWTDVPLGEDMDYGKLNLIIESEEDRTIMLKKYETGGFGATIWKSVNSLSLENECKLYDGMTSSYIKNKNGRDLTGIWTLINGNRTLYVHQVENIVWSLGIDNGDNFARVFRGEITKEYTIIGEWADVDRKDNGELIHGKIRLKVNKSGQEAVSFQEGDSPELTFRRLV
jgi:hypothetical protein